MTAPPGPPDLDKVTRRALAVGLYNHTWTLLETNPRTPAQDDEMIHAAHASRYHWGEVGTDVNLGRGEWLCARVYSVLGRAEPALHHARRCLALTEASSEREEWDLPGAYEAMARASLVAGARSEAASWKARALAVLADVADTEDRTPIQADLDSLAV